MEAITYSVIGGLVIEIVKFVISLIIDITKEGNLSFSIAGYWCAYHKDINDGGKEVEIYELLHLKYRKDTVEMVLYQIVDERNEYVYNGVGVCRGDKISVSYEETTNKNSNRVGTFILRTQDGDHSVKLKGGFYEFPDGGCKRKDKEYELKHCDTIKSRTFAMDHKKYIFSKMREFKFKDECKQG